MFYPITSSEHCLPIQLPMDDRMQHRCFMSVNADRLLTDLELSLNPPQSASLVTSTLTNFLLYLRN